MDKHELYLSFDNRVDGPHERRVGDYEYTIKKDRCGQCIISFGSILDKPALELYIHDHPPDRLAGESILQMVGLQVDCRICGCYGKPPVLQNIHEMEEKGEKEIGSLE